LAVAFGWAGWAVAVAAALALRRQAAVAADAEHELRGAVTALRLALDESANPLVRLELERLGAVPASRRAESLRAQAVGNVIANAVEHGVGTVEVINRDRPTPRAPVAGRGRGLAIAKRAARELGGRVRVDSEGGYTRTVVELPEAAAPRPAGLAARGERPAGADPAADGGVPGGADPSGEAERGATGPRDCPRHRRAA
jgi:signal transduction histidine kinase